MLRFQDIVFGPIRSRRLGSSLGVNLLPSDGKLCNFDCIYCECGWNRDGKVDKPRLPDADAVRLALEDSLKSCSAEGTVIDSITFSGNNGCDRRAQGQIFPRCKDFSPVKCHYAEKKGSG